jgi:hemoglobin
MSSEPSIAAPPAAFARLGEDAVRAITRELVERMSKDLLIGFFFAKVDLARLAELEYQHAAAFLGAPIRYEGRPLDRVHQPRRIFGGQFDRRVVILGEILAAYQVPEDIREAWLAHTRAQRPLVVAGA